MNKIEDVSRPAFINVGVDYKSAPADGHWYSADITDDPRGRGDGRFKMFADGKGGVVWNHKTGEREYFFINGGSNYKPSPEEIRQREKDKKRQVAELIKKHDKKAVEANKIWQSAVPAPEDHPYLQKKSIKPNGVKVGTWKRKYVNADNDWKTLSIENSLLIPLFNEFGYIRNIQAIFPEESPELGRDREFLPTSKSKGLFWWLGDKSEDVVCICEGFSTASTIHEHTGYRVYIAFYKDNLLDVGISVRKHLPKSKIIFCADNDLHLADNPGITKANEAAYVVNGLVAAPPVAGDFNDYAAKMGGGIL